MEIGFGTGLNAFITFLEAKKINQTILEQLQIQRKIRLI